MNIKPLRDKILVKPESAEEMTKSGIVLPETAKEKPQQGKVIAVGSGILQNGQVTPLEVKEGDTVIYEKYGAEEIKVDNEEYVVITEDKVLAVITN